MTFKTKLVLTKAVGFVAYCLVMAVCFPCLLCFRLCFCRGGCVKHFVPPVMPPPLPTRRLDIKGRPRAEQPESCSFLQLPLEIRHCIYEHALGGRLICLALRGSQHHRHHVVTSTCFDEQDKRPSQQKTPVDGVSISLLRSCRQVYEEAIPILHQHNTFHFCVCWFDSVLLGGLGQYCLPDIRRMHLYHSYTYYGSEPPWAAVFVLLHQMRLQRLTFEFHDAWEGQTDFTPPSAEALLDTEWGRGVLAIRNLSELDITFDEESPVPQEYKADVEPELRRLMLGRNADDRYRIFLQEREKRIADSEIDC
ncbi:hypothetical protein C8R43DRAFT_453336 [Mycena crocata]|nr:hypothetical protein C8R43DRAFT_453336 [Mycena crocata]